jgi:hypothetical protein
VKQPPASQLAMMGLATGGVGDATGGVPVKTGSGRTLEPVTGATWIGAW